MLWKERCGDSPYQQYAASHQRQLGVLDRILGRDASLQEATCAVREESVGNGSSTDHAVCSEEGDAACRQSRDVVLVHVTAETRG
jgi:hypothetical protein